MSFLVASFAGNAVPAFGALGGSLGSSIFRRKLMPALTMGHSLKPRAVSRPAEGKPFRINLFVFREYLSGLPAKRKSLRERVMVQTRFFGPLHDRLGFALVSYANITVSIVRLLFSRSPPAVFWRIRTGIIAPFQGSTIGARAHVCFKSSEAFPPRAHIYPLTSVPGIMRVIRVVAAVTHLKPDLINWGIGFSVSLMHTPSLLQRQE